MDSKTVESQITENVQEGIQKHGKAMAPVQTSFPALFTLLRCEQYR